jgi:hypothetical protein
LVQHKRTVPKGSWDISHDAYQQQGYLANLGQKRDNEASERRDWAHYHGKQIQWEWVTDKHATYTTAPKQNGTPESWCADVCQT